MTQEAKMLLGIGVATIALVLGAAFIFGRSSQAPLATEKVDETLLVRNDSNKTGSPSAKVKLVEFGDYQCPACSVVHVPVKQLVHDYSDKILFVFRNYPLSQHQNALVAAEAAEAAGKQGKYWEMHDMLYERQQEWGESKKAMDYFTGYAKEIGLDENTFTQDVKSNKFAAKIQADQDDGDALGVNATPTFYINGQKFTDNLSYESLKKAIDAAMPK
ncbi:hypothetical protein A2Z00_01090 [Candidatus Gottesmanbacteria bacterium RBG_13_45_10]|uniref:Thioredoxin domain-containing protein n=1 Tax=Candidatus Gottesmanbacteria bacterium RBG_13_45_10 TaxID=1798370 RepID=A0A1F5ZGK7_9BACT|nr:MAG: hypothetical protein A2Z00_01090 [Candidatus Gottesmanbacteria bacterium RBG_13_45_10]